MKKTDRVDLTHCNAQEVQNHIQQSFQKYGKENVHFELEMEYDYGNTQYPKAYLCCFREETSEERDKRVTEETVYKEKDKERKRILFESLKKEFE